MQFEGSRSILLWIKFGPYHLARLGTLAGEPNVWGIECSSTEEKYGWSPNGSEPRVITLSPVSYERTGTFSLIVALLKCLNSLKPRVLFIPGYSQPVCLAAALWGVVHAATPVLMSDSTVRDASRSRIKELAKRLIIRLLFDRGFVSGTRARDYLINLGMAESRICLGYDVVDNNHFETGVQQHRACSSREDFGLPDHYFLCVARLSDEKNHEVLLRSFFKYRESKGSWSLVLVGMGANEATLRKVTDESSFRDHVLFAGYKSYVDILPYYAFASSLILPSKSEPWGLVLNEAMAAGVPVIASDACGACDDLVTDGETGLVFEHCSEEALMQAMLRMSSFPPQDYVRMVIRGKERVGGYSLDAFRRAFLSTVQACTQ